MKTSSLRGMSFLDHLEVLRKKLLSVLITFFIFSGLFFFFGETIVSFLTAPLSRIPVSLISIRPQEKLIAYIRAAAMAGFITSLPILAVQIYSFVVPALKPGEKRIFSVISLVMVLFFAAGVTFSYYIILPFAASFFFSFSAGDGIIPTWSIGAYVELALSLLLLIGGIFQIPLPLLFLVRTGIVELKTLKKLRKQVILVVFITAAFITPPDIFTQAAVGIILYLLYELTLLAGRIAAPSGERPGKE